MLVTELRFESRSGETADAMVFVNDDNRSCIVSDRASYLVGGVADEYVRRSRDHLYRKRDLKRMKADIEKMERNFERTKLVNENEEMKLREMEVEISAQLFPDRRKGTNLRKAAFDTEFEFSQSNAGERVMAALPRWANK